MGKYDDIIDLPHHVSDYRRPMPLENRAAQFAPFAALSGHDEAINETSRLTSERHELSEEEKDEINRMLHYALDKKCLITIIYFYPDKTKSGGSYERLTGRVKSYDEIENSIRMKDGTVIPVEFISEIKGTFNNFS